MIVRLNQFAGRASNPEFTARLAPKHIAESCHFMERLYVKPTIQEHDAARVQKLEDIYIPHAWVIENSRFYADAGRACHEAGAFALGVALTQTAARLMQVGRHAPTKDFILMMCRKMSRIRAKQSEIFIRELFQAEIDMGIHAHGDGGIDARLFGYWVQIKRYGTQKSTRGNVRFVVDSNDKYYVEDPPWDLGLVVEDDPFDMRAWRFAGWVTYAVWRYGKTWGSALRQPAWGVNPPLQPSALFTWDWTRPTDLRWDPLNAHPFLGFPREPARPWPPEPENFQRN